MNFILFTLGIVSLFWSMYEIKKEESTLLKTFSKKEAPLGFWTQIIVYSLIGLTLLYFSFF